MSNLIFLYIEFVVSIFLDRLIAQMLNKVEWGFLPLYNKIFMYTLINWISYWLSCHGEGFYTNINIRGRALSRYILFYSSLINFF